MSRDSHARLSDILSRISAIGDAEHVMTTAEEAGDDALVAVAFDAILYDLVVIGEAVRALPDDLMAQEPGVPWRLIVGMRNHLAHEYFRLRPELVVRTIDLPLRDVAEACARLLSTESG